MRDTIHIATSLSSALFRAMDVVSNNVANANTAGFKGERSVFEAYLGARAADGEVSTFVLDRGSYVDPQQGPVVATGNSLDLALSGEGWFGYLTADGTRAYGRDGGLSLDTEGNLVTRSGARLLDEGGAPIALPPGSGANVTISGDGTISTPEDGVLGRVGRFEIDSLQRFERRPGGLFVPPEGEEAAAVASEATQVVQGALERSNVEPVVEMTRMIEIQRAYERANRVVETEDQLLRDMLRRLGQA